MGFRMRGGWWAAPGGGGGGFRAWGVGGRLAGLPGAGAPDGDGAGGGVMLGLVQGGDFGENPGFGALEFAAEAGVAAAVRVGVREVGDIGEEGFHEAHHQPHDRQRGNEAGMGVGLGRATGHGGWPPDAGCGLSHMFL